MRRGFWQMLAGDGKEDSELGRVVVAGCARWFEAVWKCCTGCKECLEIAVGSVAGCDCCGVFDGSIASDGFVWRLQMAARRGSGPGG